MAHPVEASVERDKTNVQRTEAPRIPANDPPRMLPPELWPNVEHLITEDDTPVDNFFSVKQQRLLVESLYSSWSGPGPERTFLADANVGVFAIVQNPPVVPDVFLSLDVAAPTDWWTKAGRSYLLWEVGKAPDVVIEIVSNREGEENSAKRADYARMAVPYYIIFDPAEYLQQGVLQVYQLDITTRTYEQRPDGWLAGIGLGVTLWEGLYEGSQAQWLRWCDAQGELIATGAERAIRAEEARDQERQRAEQAEQAREQERQRAEQAEQAREQERQRAEQAEQRAEQLAARLRTLGIDPDQ